jgi:hypothetical protein
MGGTRCIEQDFNRGRYFGLCSRFYVWLVFVRLLPFCLWLAILCSVHILSVLYEVIISCNIARLFLSLSSVTVLIAQVDGVEWCAVVCWVCCGVILNY